MVLAPVLGGMVLSLVIVGGEEGLLHPLPLSTLTILILPSLQHSPHTISSLFDAPFAYLTSRIILHIPVHLHPHAMHLFLDPSSHRSARLSTPIHRAHVIRAHPLSTCLLSPCLSPIVQCIHLHVPHALKLDLSYWTSVIHLFFSLSLLPRSFFFWVVVPPFWPEFFHLTKITTSDITILVLNYQVILAWRSFAPSHSLVPLFSNDPFLSFL